MCAKQSLCTRRESKFTMARGLSRELSQQKTVKDAAAKNKGNQEALTVTQRNERDAKVMQEKAAAKAAAKSALAASGDAGAAEVAADDARKAAAREKAKERRASETQIGKQNAKLGVFQPPTGGMPGKDGAATQAAVAAKPKLTDAEKKKKLAAAALAAAGGAVPKKKPVVAKAAEEEKAPAAAAAAAEPMEVDAGKSAGKSAGQKMADAAGKALASSEEAVAVPERKLDAAEVAKAAQHAAAAAERKTAPTAPEQRLGPEVRRRPGASTREARGTARACGRACACWALRRGACSWTERVGRDRGQLSPENNLQRPSTLSCAGGQDLSSQLPSMVRFI